MKLRSKLKGLAVLLGALLLVFAVLALWLLPVYVRHMVITTLEEAGLPGVDLRVSSLSHKRVKFTNFTAGADGLRVESIEANYSIGSVLEGRVRNVRVSGCMLTLALVNGAIDWGPLAGLAGDGTWEAYVPFERLEFKSCALALKSNGGIVEVPFEGLVEDDSENEPRVRCALSSGIPGGGKLKGEGILALKKEGISGELKVTVPQFTIGDGGLLGKCLPAAQGYEIGGDVSLGSVIRFNEGKIDPRVLLGLIGVSVRNKLSKTEVEGVDVSVAVSNFQPLETDPDLLLTVKKVRFGEFETDSVRVTFWMDDNRLRWKSFEGGWADGKIKSEGGSFLLFSQAWDIDIDVQLEGVSLQKVIDFLCPGRIECEGKLYGHIPMTVHMGKRSRVDLGEGFLEARPPRGWIKIKEEDAKELLGIKEVVPLEQASKEEVVKLMALQAFQDMEYTELAFRFAEEENRGWVVRGMIRGSGPRGGESPIPIGGFGENIYGLEDIVNGLLNGVRLIEFASKSSEEEEEEDALNKAIEDFF